MLYGRPKIMSRALLRIRMRENIYPSFNDFSLASNSQTDKVPSPYACAAYSQGHQQRPSLVYLLHAAAEQTV